MNFDLYLWKNHDEANISKVKEELADVFAYAFLLADKYNYSKIIKIDSCEYIWFKKDKASG